MTARRVTVTLSHWHGQQLDLLREAHTRCWSTGQVHQQAITLLGSRKPVERFVCNRVGYRERRTGHEQIPRASETTFFQDTHILDRLAIHLSCGAKTAFRLSLPAGMATPAGLAGR
jgi:hypothetical protein